MVKGFSKMYNFSFFGQIFVLQTFLLYNWIFQKINSIFENLQIFLQILKGEHKSFYNDVSFVIFGHQTWGLEGGGQIEPPLPSISWFSNTPAEIGLK